MNLNDIPSLFFSKSHHDNRNNSNNNGIIVFGSTIVLTLEKFIVTTLFIIISFLFLRERVRLSHDRFSTITIRLKRKFLHLVKGFSSSNDYNDDEDNEMTVLQKQFEEAWPTIRMSSYRSLVLPPSCRKVTWKNRDGDSRHGTMTKSRDVIWESLKRLSLSARKISATTTNSESTTDNTSSHEPPPPPPLSSPPPSPSSTPFSSPLQQQPRRFPNLATIFHKPNNDTTTTTDQDMNFFDAETSTRGIQRLHRTAPVPDRHGYILGDEFLPLSTTTTSQKHRPHTPLLVFVNTRSGPQQGLLVLHQLRRLLNPIQVWDLGRDGPPATILSSFLSKFSRLRLAVCGGDGTVGWILSSLETLLATEEYGWCKWPPMAIVPLGTGNDLARVHGWGGGYSNENLVGVLERIDGSYVSLLDRWELEVDVVAGDGGGTKRRGKMAAAGGRRGRKRRGMSQRVVTKAFTNYLGVGVDAQTAFQVHMLRESKPNLFFSRIINKAWYFIAGAEDFMNPSCTDLARKITLYADGVEIPIPADSQGIIFLNIDSYAGGVPLWRSGESSLRKRRKMKRSGSCPRLAEDGGDFAEGYGLTYPFNRASCFNTYKRDESMERSESADSLDNLSHTSSTTSSTSTTTPLTDEQKLHNLASSSHHPSSCQDGMLDVVSIRGTFHLGQIRMGLGRAQRICQCRTATIRTTQKLAVHVDGEPWKQPPCTLTVRRKTDPACMLHCGAGRIDDYGGANGRGGGGGGNGDGEAVAVMAREVSRLLDWAEEAKVIDKAVHGTLAREFSRRVEMMEGERRERRRKTTAQEQLMIKLRKVLTHDADF